MTVVVADVAAALGRTAPETGSLEYMQWTMWITDAEMLISARLGNLAELEQQILDYVVREAVVAQVRRPDDATSVEIAVDDAREARRYSSGRGRVTILDEWWDLLSPSSGGGKAFAIDSLPSDNVIHAETCTLNFGGLYCSCGADIAGFPLFEEA